MSIGNYSITTRATGTVLTATIYNADHQNHVNNQNPQGTGAYSDTVGQMQITRSPGGIGSESLASSLADEIASLRYMIQQITGQAQWYAPSPYPFQVPTVVNKSANYTVVAGDTASYLNATATLNFTLPSLGSIAANQSFFFKNSSTGNVVLVPNGADTIDGLNANYQIPAYEFMMLISTASGWIVRQKPSKGVGEIYAIGRQSAGIGELLCFGQAISRTTYAGLAAAIKIATTGNTTNTSNIVTNIPSTTGMDVGMAFENGSFAAGTTITSVDSATQIHVSNNATANTTGSAITVWPHGGGDGATTFNAPDIRGRVLAGADVMGGTNANRLHGTNTGNVTGSNPGMAGGENNHTLVQAELPNVTLSLGVHATDGASGGSSNIPGGQAAAPNTSAQTSALGSGNSHNVTQPTLQENYVVKL